MRKTMPKRDLPINVYLYCCKSKKKLFFDKVYNKYMYGEDTPKDRFNSLNGKVVAKFTLNKDVDLIIATSFLSVETEDLNEMFYQQYFEDVKITDENGDEYTFSVNMPVSFKKGTYTISMKRGNATQDELYSFGLWIYVDNKYDQISSEETGDITLEAYYQPVLEKVAYLDRDKMIGSFGTKNINGSSNLTFTGGNGTAQSPYTLK